MTPRMQQSSRPKPRAAVWWALSVGLIGAGVAVLRPPSYDGLYWLTVARRLFGAGDIPYFDVLDNKGPVLYLIVGAADLLPGSERVTLSLLFGLVTGVLALGVFRILERRGCPRGWSILTTVLSVGAAGALGAFTVTAELTAVAFLAHALAARSSWAKAMLAFAAMLVDVRAVVIVMLLLTFWWKKRELRRGHALALVIATAASIAVVLVVPPLRLAFLESALGNRDASEMGRVVLLGISALLPALTLLVVVARSRPSKSVAFLIAAGILIGAASLVPFAHYWVYLVLPLALVEFDRTSLTGVAVGACAVALIPLVAVGIQETQVDVRYHDYLGETAAETADFIRPDDRVFVWSALPHLRVRYASSTVDFAPTAVYLTWDVPNRARLLDDFAERLDSATVVVAEASLDPAAVVPEVREAQAMVSERVATSSCLHVAGRAVVYRLNESC